LKLSRRHKKLKFTSKVVSRISEINRDEWNKVFPDVLESYDFFKTLDESGFDQFSFRYIAVYNRKTIVGATHCFILKYSMDTSINGPLRRLTNFIKKANPEIFNIKAVACGSPVGQCRIGISDDKDRILNVILRRLEQIARKEKASIIAFKDFNNNYKKMIAAHLKKEGFVGFNSLPTTLMDLRFKNFEEYMQALSGATRYDLRRKFRASEKHGKVEMEIVDQIDGRTLEDAYKLYLQMLETHDMAFEIVPKDFFSNISKNMPGNIKFFLWRIDGKMAAFLFAMVKEDMFIDYYLGLDYALAHKYHLYFVKFRDVMSWCIKHKIKEYEMGITGYEPKRRLGFNFEHLYLYVKYRNAFIRPFFNFFAQFLKFENFDPELKKILQEDAL